LKQIITLLSFYLLLCACAHAAPETNITETQIPQLLTSQAAEKLNTPTVLPTAIPLASVYTEVSSLSNYQLAPGDALMISVWKEEGLQEQQYLISPDGSIIFPLIGTVIASGKTITELKDALVTRLADYISDPSVTVKLMNNQGNSIFVIGKVNKPGQYFASRKVDVLQALSLAGGITVYADSNSISVLRRMGNEIKVFPFDYSDVIHGEELEQNILLEPGDTVTVP
jgi:polysaccharide export outer membrane protein